MYLINKNTDFRILNAMKPELKNTMTCRVDVEDPGLQIY